MNPVTVVKYRGIIVAVELRAILANIYTKAKM